MSSISEVYSQGLLKYGGEENCALFIQQLHSFCNAINVYPQLWKYFQLRAIPKKKKLELIDNIADILKLDKKIINFLHLLVVKQRLQYIVEIVSALERFYSQKKILSVKLESPIELDSKSAAELKEIIAHRLNKRLHLVSVCNREMIFGFRLQFNYTLLDLSLTEIFTTLREQWRKTYA
ncbi:MAG TPA: hypothetical protein ENF60_00840 [Candidatus Omnitrophica bacterium]|nr:hypothetical protein [Candidatus Omnitrophota bacterium]